MSSEFLQAADLGFNVVNHNVEVHAVLAASGFGYSLKEKRWSDPFLRNEYGQCRLRVVVAIVQGIAPERSEPLGVCAVQDEFHTCLVSHRMPPRPNPTWPATVRIRGHLAQWAGSPSQQLRCRA